MNDDKSKNLSDVAYISVGYPFRGTISEGEGSGMFVVQMKDVSRSQRVDWDSCTETELTGKRKPDWLSTGDILFTSRGRHNYAVIINDLPADKKAVASPHFFVIRSKQENLLPEYLTWLLNKKPCQRYFQRQTEGSFTKNIRRDVLEKTPVIIPSLQEQQTIIRLSKTLHEEQQILKQIIHNGEATMNAIAEKLSNTSNSVRGKK